MFIVPMDKLKIGDILLTSENSRISKVVRKVTGSDFSHVILYLGGSSFIHADSDGVHSNNLQRLIFDKESDVKVLRLKEGKLSEDSLHYARTQIGTQYSIAEAINAKTKFKNKTNDNRQFCSRLVAQTYESAGIELVNNSDFCTPKDIEDSSLLIEVEKCTKVATEQDLQFASSDAPLEKQIEITNTILKEVRLLTKGDIQKFGQITSFVRSNPQFDSKINDVFEKSGYLSMWKTETKKNTWRYNKGEFLSVEGSAEEKIEHATKEITLAKNDVVRYDKQLEIYTGYNKGLSIPLKYIDSQVKLYKTLKELAVCRCENFIYCVQVLNSKHP